jgi:hypothetical protein
MLKLVNLFKLLTVKLVNVAGKIAVVSFPPTAKLIVVKEVLEAFKVVKF